VKALSALKFCDGSRDMTVKTVAIARQPLLIFGGCYSNYHATKALYDWAQNNGFSADQCICTGDIVAYCADPVDTAELVQQWGVHCIQGNVEQSLAGDAQDCGCGFEEGSVCGSVSRFLFESSPDNSYKEELATSNADIILAGHSGLPFTRSIDKKVWHNSGALGMPANDGTDRVWFSVMDIADNNGAEIQFTHHSLRYDAPAAQKNMQKNGLTQGYEVALTTGLWPSMPLADLPGSH